MDLMYTAQLLGNFGEFFGAIAVVVTLAYLAIQVRHSRAATEVNTNALRSAASALQAETFIGLTRPGYENPSVAPFVTRLQDVNIGDLSAEDLNRDREALAGFPSHTTRHTGPYHGGSI